MKLARTPERTIIFELNMYEVAYGRKRLEKFADASELLTNEDIYNKIDVNASDTWKQVADGYEHFLLITAPYQIEVKFGEHGEPFTVDKLFATQGQNKLPIFIKSNYFEDDNTYVNVRCTIQVS